MSLAPRATEAAIASFPGAVTLGFAPYEADLAREAGHEVVLQIPMEPFDFPPDNPGPHTLLAGAGKAANIDNLTWLMSRFAGYAGIANFLRGKLTADAKALTPVLRGSIDVDETTSAQSLAMYRTIRAIILRCGPETLIRSGKRFLNQSRALLIVYTILVVWNALKKYGF